MSIYQAFMLGIREVHSDLTTNCDDYGVQDWYERGRYLAAFFVRREILR